MAGLQERGPQYGPGDIPELESKESVVETELEAEPDPR